MQPEADAAFNLCYGQDLAQALAPPKDLIETCYLDKPFSRSFNLEDVIDEQHTEAALLAWSGAVELAVDKAVQISHRLNPLVHPWPSLHPKFKGRCNFKKTFRTSTHSTVRDDPTGSFNPVTEIFSVRARQIVRQVRRLKSFRRALKAFSETGDPLRVERQHLQLLWEWKTILNAKGFGHRWASWILAFELVPFVPVCIPGCDILDLCIDITEMHCNMVCRQETSAKRDTFRHHIQVDHNVSFACLTVLCVGLRLLHCMKFLMNLLPKLSCCGQRKVIPSSRS